MDTHSFFSDRVKMGKKGQITIPKRIRDEDGIKEDDTFIVTHTPGGDIIMSRQKVSSPEDAILEAVQRMPSFDWRGAWSEVQNERKRERS